MWIKVDGGEVINLNGFYRFQAFEPDSSSDSHRVDVTKGMGDVITLCKCETREEALRVRDNIFYCLARDREAVDVADLRGSTELNLVKAAPALYEAVKMAKKAINCQYPDTGAGMPPRWIISVAQELNLALCLAEGKGGKYQQSW